MYKQNRIEKSQSFKRNDDVGETIEEKVKRLSVNGEPIDDGAPIIYTERKSGVMPEYNVRTDRWEIAATAMDVVHRNKIANNSTTPTESENTSVTGTNGDEE